MFELNIHYLKENLIMHLILKFNENYPKEPPVIIFCVDFPYKGYLLPINHGKFKGLYELQLNNKTAS